MTRAISLRGSDTKYFFTRDMYASCKPDLNERSLASARMDLICWLLIMSHRIGYFDRK